MIADALKHLEEQSRKAAGVTVLDKTDPRFRRELIDGSVVETPIRPEVRTHVVTDLRDIPAAAAKWGAEGGVCFVSSSRVSLLLDDADRRDVVNCPLVYTAVLHKLLEHQNKPLAQRAFLDLLIEVLEDFMDPMISDKVARVKGLTQEGFVSEIDLDSGRDKGVAEFLQETNADNPFPTKVDFCAPVFRDLPCETQESITCRLKVTQQKPNVFFALQPLPDELDLAVANALRRIAEWLRENLPKRSKDPFPVFIGTP